ncbi:MAG: hypothetical protein AB1640_00035 [bacterium]
MGRRDQWKQACDSMLGEFTKPKTFEEREKVPEKACGLCKNFSENAYVSDGRGTCGVLKTGSDVALDPPVYVTEGEAGLITFFNKDGARCAHFARMEMIDKDGAECADPAFRRAHRQMEKMGK